MSQSQGLLLLAMLSLIPGAIGYVLGYLVGLRTTEKAYRQPKGSARSTDPERSSILSADLWYVQKERVFVDFETLRRIPETSWVDWDRLQEALELYTRQARDLHSDE